MVTCQQTKLCFIFGLSIASNVLILNFHWSGFFLCYAFFFLKFFLNFIRIKHLKIWKSHFSFSQIHRHHLFALGWLLNQSKFTCLFLGWNSHFLIWLLCLGSWRHTSWRLLRVSLLACHWLLNRSFIDGGRSVVSWDFLRRFHLWEFQWWWRQFARRFDHLVI